MTVARLFGIACGLAIIAAGWASPALAQAGAAQTAGPSFSCTSARTAAEKAICADPALAKADREMAALFARAQQSAFGSGPSNQLAAQRLVVKDMRSCGASASAQRLRECLASTYAGRNRDLATAILMRAPETAIPVLRRLDPGFAPLLEAVQLWAREPVNADWAAPTRAASRQRIAALLSPYLTELRTNKEQSFGWSLVSDPAGGAAAVTRIDDIFRSERHFAALLHVLGPYLPDETGAGGGAASRSLPCAAIVRHPALLDATDSLFGSTMDNFVLRSDCKQTLPPTPALNTLDTSINHTWPDCDGTIRFAAYRSYQNAVDLARLGQAPHSKLSRPAPPEGVPPVEIAAARSELARYYAAYLGKAPVGAAIMASDGIAGMLSAAHSCGT